MALIWPRRHTAWAGWLAGQGFNINDGEIKLGQQ